MFLDRLLPELPTTKCICYALTCRKMLVDALRMRSLPSQRLPEHWLEVLRSSTDSRVPDLVGRAVAEFGLIQGTLNIRQLDISVHYSARYVYSLQWVDMEWDAHGQAALALREWEYDNDNYRPTGRETHPDAQGVTLVPADEEGELFDDWFRRMIAEGRIDCTHCI